jgi:nucleoside-diphosphate-sugar epimerase
VYNIRSFSVSAGQIADRVHRAFPAARIEYEPDPVRARIVASWPRDVDDGRARNDWGWHPAFDWDRTFDDYLLPRIKAQYATHAK